MPAGATRPAYDHSCLVSAHAGHGCLLNPPRYGAEHIISGERRATASRDDPFPQDGVHDLVTREEVGGVDEPGDHDEEPLEEDSDHDQDGSEERPLDGRSGFLCEEQENDTDQKLLLQPMGTRPSHERDVQVLHALKRFFGCGNPMNGFARIRCPDCGHERLLVFSCKCRGSCPSCQARRAEEWAAWVVEERLAAVPHHHVVFTLPKDAAGLLPI